MKFAALLFLLFSIFGFLAAAPSSYATDCSKASTPIDQALCSDSLRSNDNRLNTIFSDIHSYLPAAQAATFLAEQRAWLKQRDGVCGSLADHELVQCLWKETDGRADDLLEHFEKDHSTKVVTGAFELGDHKLVLDDRQITEGEKPIVQNTYDNGNGSIDVEDGFHSKDVDAVAVLVSDGGTLDCREDYVLWARHGAPVQVIAGHGEDDCPNSVSITPDGIEFEGKTDEITGRRDDYWSFKSGKFREEIVAFKPQPGTKIADMAQTLEGGGSPLENEEFYDILEHLGNRISHPSTDIAKEVLQYSLLDTQAVPGYLILSGCHTPIRDSCADKKGRYIREAPQGDVTSGFIAISLTTKKAFYALDSGPPTGMSFYPEETCGAPHSIAVFPSQGEWPPELLKALDSWITDEDCG